ncbi:MAG TPA: glycosyltransferase, partial [Actinomycetota bacterium]|nr:glycosyltransferase [Actinomycetota bacterium]
ELRELADAVTSKGVTPEIEFAGRLDHDPLSKLLPTFDLLVVPSVVPEAFGMVAAEAAACGVLPLVPGHSGIGEVGATLEAALDRPGLLTFDPLDPVRDIARGIDRVLALDPRDRRELGRRAVQVARELWSWDGVAARLLALATD